MMRNAVTAHVETLVATGQFSKAEEMVKNADQYKIKNAGKLFGTTEGVNAMKSVKVALYRAREQADEKFADNTKGVRRSVDALMQDIADPNVTAEERQVTALRMAQRAGVEGQEAEAFAQQVATGDIDDFINAYRDLARSTENENTRDLLNDQLGEINRAKKEYFGGSASTIGTFSAEDFGELETSIRAVLDKKPKTPRTYLPMSVGGRKVNREDPDYIEMMNRINMDYEWATVPSQKGSIIANAQRTIRSKEGGLVRSQTRCSNSVRIRCGSPYPVSRS